MEEEGGLLQQRGDTIVQWDLLSDRSGEEVAVAEHMIWTFDAAIEGIELKSLSRRFCAPMSHADSSGRFVH